MRENDNFENFYFLLRSKLNPITTCWDQRFDWGSSLNPKWSAQDRALLIQIIVGEEKLQQWSRSTDPLDI